MTHLEIPNPHAKEFRYTNELKKQIKRVEYYILLNFIILVSAIILLVIEFL
jgi:hypothetical protein